MPRKRRAANPQPARGAPAETWERRFALEMSERLDLPDNDAANAARLMARHGAALIFVDGKGWGIWDGARFSFAEGDVRARALGFDLEATILEEAAASVEAPVSDLAAQRRLAEETMKARPAFLSAEAARQALVSERRGRLMKHATKLGNVNKVEAALRAAEHRALVPLAELDTDPWTFVCANGRIDLRRAAYDIFPEAAEPEEVEAVRAAWLSPHTREGFPTKASPIAYDPAATCPGWDAFMALVFPDADVRACFQRGAGALLFGRNEAQCAFLLRGHGSNGKSTVMRGLEIVLGERDGYVVPAKIEMFLMQPNGRSAAQATPEEVDVPGARAVFTSEPEPTDILSAKAIKGFTGGDRRPARALNKPQFYYRPACIPVISFNRTPKIKGEDEGLRRRMVFFPFVVNLRELPPEKRRSEAAVEDELRAEASGRLNWLLDGWRDYRRRADAGLGQPPGIDPPATMQDLKASLLESADPVGTFLRDCCDLVMDGKAIRGPEMYAVYQAWCASAGGVEYRRHTFDDLLVEKGLSKGQRTTGGQRVWGGVLWKAGTAMDGLLGVAGYPRTPASDAPEMPAPDEEPPF